MSPATTISGLEFERLGHSAFRIESDEHRVYVDAFEEVLSGEEPPGDLLLSTHDHWDHFDPDAIDALADDGATAVVHETSDASSLDVETRQVAAGESVSLQGVGIRAVPAHNLIRERAPGEPFHPEGGGVGYVVEIDGMSVYHTGDTEPLDHMVGIDADVMLVPVGGAYVMSLDDAYWALHLVEPDVAVPMHYGHIDDSKPDASGFEKLIDTLNGDADIVARVV